MEQKPFMPLFSTCDMRILADNDGAMMTFFQSWLNYILNFNVSQGITAATGTQNPYELNYAFELTLLILPLHFIDQAAHKAWRSCFEMLFPSL